MPFIEVLKLIITLLPIVIDAIKTVEKSVDAAKSGSDKLEVVKTIVQTAYTVSTDNKPAFEALWEALQKVISGLVKLFNAKGW